MPKRGTVWIAPSTFEVPRGRMVDPATSWFWVSWQDEALVESKDVLGAEAAIAWGRDRSGVVLIRLGHAEETYFSAGTTRNNEMPEWPPSEIPAEGWFVPDPDDRWNE